jgi:hypothetical protein
MKAARALPAKDQRAGGLLFAESRDVLRSLLTVLIVVVALRPGAAVAQKALLERVPTPLGGLSEKEALSLLLPGYVEPPPPSQDPNAEPEWNVTRARVTESLVSDFGLGAGSFALVLVNGSRGACTQCGFAVVGLIDPAKHRVIWRLEPDHFGGYGLATFSLFEEDTRLAFAFRIDAGAQTHGSYLRQTIYRPRQLKGGGIECDLVWSDLVGSAAGLGAMEHMRCASMDRAGTGPDWTYRRRSFFGAWLDDGTEGEAATAPLGLPCKDGDGEQRVEIRRVERWRFEVATGHMSRNSVRSERVDHAPSTRFPFSLPVRKAVWSRVEQRAAAAARPLSEVHSPTERFRIRRSHQSYGKDEVALLDRTGDGIRSLQDWHSEFFEGSIEALGWAEDESRFFVVVAFEGERALLSFSVKGTDDYWEELLDPYDKSWSDGFVMRHAQPTPSR